MIDEARQTRHRMGGAMRQAGVIAAAALVGLEEMVDRLADDHRRAGVLAEAVASAGRTRDAIPTGFGRTSSSSPTRTRRSSSRTSVPRGCWPAPIAPDVVRLVTHNDVDDAGLEHAALLGPDRASAALASRPMRRSQPLSVGTAQSLVVVRCTRTVADRDA